MVYKHAISTVVPARAVNLHGLGQEEAEEIEEERQPGNA
jgi:sRNA-binding regulator protein Hfq